MRPGLAKALKKAACELSNHDHNDLFGPCRAMRLVEWRMVVMWLMRERGRWSWHQIGRFLDRDHSTCIHGWRTIEEWLDPASNRSMTTRFRIETIWQRANEMLDAAEDRRAAA